MATCVSTFNESFFSSNMIVFSKLFSLVECIRVYGLAETFGKKDVMVEGIIFMKDQDPKKHLALGFVAENIKYGAMLENIYGKFMSNYPWVTMKEAGILLCYVCPQWNLRYTFLNR